METLLRLVKYILQLISTKNSKLLILVESELSSKEKELTNLVYKNNYERLVKLVIDNKEVFTAMSEQLKYYYLYNHSSYFSLSYSYYSIYAKHKELIHEAAALFLISSPLYKIYQVGKYNASLFTWNNIFDIAKEYPVEIEETKVIVNCRFIYPVSYYYSLSDNRDFHVYKRYIHIIFLVEIQNILNSQTTNISR